MNQKRFSNIIGFDDAPFPRGHEGMVKVVGAVFADLRFDGVLIGEVEKDGSDAGEKLAGLVSASKFAEHVQLIMLQGIALGGFNVVDVFYLNKKLGIPIMVVSRNKPDMESIKNTLTVRIQDGDKKWEIIEKLGPMEAAGNIYIQRVGLSVKQAEDVMGRFAIHSHIPEPVRAAHLIAGALTYGQSRGNP